MTEITIQNVSQKKHSMTAEQYYKGGQNYAATSLIGNVGSEKGAKYISDFLKYQA